MNNELIPEPSWWKRNWSWALPLGGCLTVIIIVIISVASIFFGVTSMLDDSIPIEHGLEKINSDPEIVELMGSPIEKSGMPQGDFNWKNDTKRVDIRVPISGPKENGTLFIIASATDDNWIYHEIRVVVQDSTGVNSTEDDWE